MPANLGLHEMLGAPVNVLYKDNFDVLLGLCDNLDLRLNYKNIDEM